MNTLTPETHCPKCKRPINMGNSPNASECHETNDDEGLCEAYAKISKLECKRDEARTRGDTYGQKYAACILEREKLKAELKQMSMCLDASNDARAMLGNERDQLRKVCDELALHLACIHKETGCQSQCSAIIALNNYNSLPHVIAAKKGTTAQ